MESGFLPPPYPKSWLLPNVPFTVTIPRCDDALSLANSRHVLPIFSGAACHYRAPLTLLASQCLSPSLYIKPTDRLVVCAHVGLTGNGSSG